MKKILMMLLLLVSTNVFAVDWVAVAGGNNDSTHYVDSQSIRRDGNKVKAWTLYDFKSGEVLGDNKTRYLSSLARLEFDCFEGTLREIDAYSYSGNMMKGDIVLSEPNLTMLPTSALPGSVGAIDLKLVCATK
jgi:hypothetical protein